MVPNPVHISG
ncbi:hypothetical protein ACHAW6_000289 [Cyclotella cf. meneghiniana]